MSPIVKKQMLVSSFKEKIAQEVGVPVGQQRLIFRGKVLKDDHLLSDYRILQVDIFLDSMIFTPQSSNTIRVSRI